MRRRRAKNKRHKQEKLRENMLLIVAALDLMTKLIDFITKLIR